MKNKEDFKTYMQCFLETNSKINLISKNDEKFLWEKHIFDSLAIEKIFCTQDLITKRLLDIGTGGGFPSIPISIVYPELEVTALDSIKKKINAISEIAKKLNLQNFKPVCDRAENLKKNFSNYYDFITSRAVAPLAKISEYALPLLKKDGYFIAYKSIKTEDEINDAKNILKKFNAKVFDIIQYDLPLEENHTRNLIIIKK